LEVESEAIGNATVETPEAKVPSDPRVVAKNAAGGRETGKGVRSKSTNRVRAASGRGPRHGNGARDAAAGRAYGHRPALSRYGKRASGADQGDKTGGATTHMETHRL
jgi:hypothetical protein